MYCRPIPGADLAELLRQAVSLIRGQYQAAELDAADIAEAAVDRGAIPADPDVKNFSYALVDEEVYFRENSVMKPVELSDAAKGRVAGMVGLRQIVNDLIGYQLEDYPDGDIQAKQAELNAAYDAFYAKYGTINSSANARVFDDDSSYYLLCSLENIDEDGRLASKADMFTKCTIRSERHVTSVDTPSEALAVSIGERGRVDLQFMSGLLGTPAMSGTSWRSRGWRRPTWRSWRKPSRKTWTPPRLTCAWAQPGSTKTISSSSWRRPLRPRGGSGTRSR